MVIWSKQNLYSVLLVSLFNSNKQAFIFNQVFPVFHNYFHHLYTNNVQAILQQLRRDNLISQT